MREFDNGRINTTVDTHVIDRRTTKRSAAARGVARNQRILTAEASTQDNGALPENKESSESGKRLRTHEVTKKKLL